MNAAKVFNDLVLLANLPKHPSSGKSRLLGSGVLFSDPNELVERVKVLLGAMAAGNTSLTLKNDLRMINDEFLKIGAIDEKQHQQFRRKFFVNWKKMKVDRVLFFNSVDARRKNPRNKAGNFTTKFTPELVLDSNKQHFLALANLSMTASWHNITPQFDNNKLVISKNGGNSWETITFPSGIFDYDDINDFIHAAIGKNSDGNFGISVSFNLSTFKVVVQLENDWRVDFTQSGNFHSLLGFEKKVVSSTETGSNFPNITNSVDNLFLRSNLLNDSIISGVPSNVLFSFSTSTKSRSMPFEIRLVDRWWSKINTKTISEVTFWFTDDLGREVDLNGIDISLTVIVKENQNGE